MTWLIGVTGYAQHGKDTVGTYLAENHGFTKAAFADQLRQCVATLDPYVGVVDTDPERGIARPYAMRYRAALDELGYEKAKKLPEVRRLLQVMGTEVGRDILGADVWVSALHERIQRERLLRVVVTDVRFPNEAQFIHDMGGVLVRVTRPGFDNGVSTEHPSEANIAGLDNDVTIAAEDMEMLLQGCKDLAQAFRLSDGG